MTITEKVFQHMSGVSKPQRKFLTALFATFMCLRGRANFRNLSRYGGFCEKTCSRQFRRDFDFTAFNRLSLTPVIDDGGISAAAFDCSFVPKSGKLTDGLAKFYNGSRGKAEKGLEISLLSLIDITRNTAYTLSVQQTPASAGDGGSRTDIYLEQLRRERPALPPCIRYPITDGWFSKGRFIDGVTGLGLEQIGKLRHDADLRFLYTGRQKARGRRRLYDGRVRFDDLSRFEPAGEADGVKLYTAVVNSPCFKRSLRIVYLVKNAGGRVQTALLFSTDLEQSAAEIYRFYKSRFQIEFLFRDAKQFTGLCDCQARRGDTLHFHFNAAMTALNLLRLEDLERSAGDGRRVISIASWKIRKANAHLLERFSSFLGLDFSSIKSKPGFESLCNYGAIAA